jgi:DNA invertase Pin-like site-specific DNA recombinase
MTLDSVAVRNEASETENGRCVGTSSTGQWPATANSSTSYLGSPKIRAQHLQRWAVVYIRQSSPQQVLQNRESRERQYALVDRAVALGWPRERVRVIDEDQGQSGKSADTRNGFQKILVDVSLDHVGLVLGLEMSRISRSCRDAYQLMEVCAVFATLLADFEGVYDPTDVNDRLLLGLKATISEVELHTMRSRLQLGKLNKARRGELLWRVPMGYLRTATDQVIMDPDEQVQASIRLVFTKFAELKSVNGVLRYLADAGVRLPVRLQSRPNRGQLEWRRPNQTTLQTILRHPQYAGAYCYGRSRTDPRRARSGRPGSSVRRVPLEQIQVLLHDRLPAYISWNQFQENQRQLAENRSRYDTRGVPRRGSALLAGLLVCGRCGYRLRVSYAGFGRPRYMCCAQQTNYGLSGCQSLAGNTLDRFVAGQVLRALEPAAIELSLMAGAGMQEERRSQQHQWQLRLERAKYESERAARQYHTVEPENRLVARELERSWERALTAQRQLEQEHDRWERETPSQLTASERARIARLARDIPALWNAPQTNDSDRKTIVRHLVEHVVVNVEGQSEIVQVTIRWAGGFESQHQLCRRVASYQQMTDIDRLMERVDQLQASGHSRAQIARQLTADGFHSPCGGESFCLSAVSRLLARLRTRAASPKVLGPSVSNTAALLGAHDWWPGDLARALNVPLSRILAWCRKGWIQARKRRGWPDRWICYADASELDRLRQLSRYQRTLRKQPFPDQLTTPRTDPHN